MYIRIREFSAVLGCEDGMEKFLPFSLLLQTCDEPLPHRYSRETVCVQ